MSVHQYNGGDGAGAALVGDPGDEVLLPAPIASRRVMDPAQRAVLMLATQFTAYRMALLQSESLLVALDHALKVGDGIPEEVVSRLLAPGPPDPAAPVESLLRRLQESAAPPPDWPPADEPFAVTSAPVSETGYRGALPGGPVSLPDDPEATDSSWSPLVYGTGEDTMTAAPVYIPRRLRRARRSTASRGWRVGVRHYSGGTVRLRPGRDERIENALIERVQAPIRGYRHVVVLSLKGGSGKTTTTVMLGHTFATHRRDRVSAIDASPDAGTLAFRIADQPTTSVRTLLEQADGLHRYTDVRPLTGHTTSRLDLVASDADPTASRPFGAAEYRRAADIMSRFYSLVLTDCGAGLMHDAMGSILDSADQVVLVVNPAVDSARSADLTLHWLDAHGYSDLVRGCVAVVNHVSRPPVVDIPEMVEHFAQRCRAVVQIPRDPHLTEGAATDLASLARATRRAYLVLAAAVADGFEDASVRRGRT